MAVDSRVKAGWTPLVFRMRNAKAILITLLLLNSLMLTGSLGIAAQEEEPTGESPEDLWSIEYIHQVFPWYGNDRIQFNQYHDYFTMKARMQDLAEQNSDIMEFHEGMPGGTNDRGVEMDIDNYEGWYYGHASPWMKITGGEEGVHGGEYNEFVGDSGNYPDRPDIMLVGNHHAREWMSYEVPMLFLETVAYYYGMDGIDNDGDGLYDEDPWGDADGDGILDDDGDCLRLNSSNQDFNGDGILCGPGDLGVDEDFDEGEITTLIDTREIYLIPMLNVDGNRYDREEYCGETAWENCRTSGWRKNLRDNTLTGITPLPDPDESIDEGCDGVDLNRNYQFEWGAPLGATGPLFPGFCYASGPNNDVYNGPVNTNDEDGDGKLNEDHVDGKDDDADGQIDEDWMGGNSEPETLFIQDLTEMNDDNGDGASEFKATLTWHSFSELVLYPWGHCTNCHAPEEAELIYHGAMMAEMTQYENMQSSDLYPTTGDFCDWHYGVHGSFCYTIEIGTAFHQSPDEVKHIAVRNLGVAFYMVKIADNPVERAQIGIENAQRAQWITSPTNLTIPETGPISVNMCVHEVFPWSNDVNSSHVRWRIVTPTRIQSDFGPKEWIEHEWQDSGFEDESGETCILNNGANGTLIVSYIDVPDDMSGELHYKGMLGTQSGTYPFEYPAAGEYYEIAFPYRAPFGNVIAAFLLFFVVVGSVWGGLGVSLKIMMASGKDEPSLGKKEAQN
ncbi:MAG: hypothetical protein HOE69_03020 [Euryarchaeota archaeon]|nr:hypothetical protein [Euryarchaeota archaeon]